MSKFIDKINTPNDIKKCTIEELKNIACDMRHAIIEKTNAIGGHIGPNLGFVEPTLALHYVFNSPIDKFVFDVSHQCYTHKMCTSRKEGFLNPENYLDISGYTNPDESPHDVFVVGHTSTSISLATGLAKARDLKNERHNVIAIIGDGSLSGGEAYEGLNNAAILNSNIIIIVNDNEMSIAENTGGLYDNLRLLRQTKGRAELNFFKTLGFEYHYVDDGNDLSSCINVFNEAKDKNNPVLIHLHTLKGKGLKCAEENKEAFHWIMPHALDEGNKPFEMPKVYKVTTDLILEKFKTDKTLVVINPATPGAVGFSHDFRSALGINKNYIDTGIAEEHSIAYASALAKAGAKPILALLSSFVQRTYDQLSQDLALNNSPATLLIYWGAISSADMTHLGSFDISLISNIPNIIYLAPTTCEEYIKMLDFSIEQNARPIAIRVPFLELKSGECDNSDYSIINKSKVTKAGRDVALIGVGDFYHLAFDVAKMLKENAGIDATVINPKFISGLDVELLESLKTNHRVVATFENGILEGGYGQKVASFYGASDMKVLNFGGKKEFTDRVSLDELYERYHLTPELATKDICACLK